MYYEDEEARALIQFAIDDDTIIVKDFEVNKMSQNVVTYITLVESMCDTAKGLVIIPSVRGESTDEAKAMLEAKGLIVDIKTIPDNDIAEGRVIRSEPTIGSKVFKGDTITFFVSTGRQSYTVENYIGKNYAEVKTKLEANGIEVDINYHEAILDSPYKKDEIFSQTPSVGTKIYSGDTVTLNVAG